MPPVKVQKHLRVAIQGFLQGWGAARDRSRSRCRAAPGILVPVNFIHPLLEPFRLLKQNHDQYHGCDRNGNDGIDDGEHDEVD